jgi:hypothetical protein
LQLRARPAMLITIDTEGDNLWSRPREITTKNVDYLPRFQSLCERHGFKPTYLTTWEMVRDRTFRRFASEALRRRAAEIGMHLHAWNSPPSMRLTGDDDLYHPFLIEYPDDTMREKVAVLTAELEGTLGEKMISHRAGRWSFDARYARILAEHGYLVDCSVTPHISWRETPGVPGGAGGTDYTTFQERPYFMDLQDIARAGSSPLLEVPVSIVRCQHSRLAELAGNAGGALSATWGRRFRERFLPYTWLRPNGRNLGQMLTLLRAAVSEGREHVEFMLHSSELMPGGSPTFATVDSIERLYRHLEALFAAAGQNYEGQTLSEFYRSAAAWRASSPAGHAAPQ